MHFSWQVSKLFLYFCLINLLIFRCSLAHIKMFSSRIKQQFYVLLSVTGGVYSLLSNVQTIKNPKYSLAKVSHTLLSHHLSQYHYLSFPHYSCDEDNDVDCDESKDAAVLPYK